jgi:DNA invertase Pin-like site-specific DNA recombinase
MRKLAAEGVKPKELAVMFNCQTARIHKILRRESWDHVPGDPVEKKKRARLTPEQVLEIRRLSLEGYGRYRIAKKYGVSVGAVQRIMLCQTWKHVHNSDIKISKKPPHVEDHPGIHLTEANVKEIRRLAASGVSQRKIAKKFKLKQQTVSKIVNRQRWRHVS